MNIDTEINTLVVRQPSGHYVQSDWGAAVNNVYTMPNICKAAELAQDAIADGVLEVHLVDDPIGKWYKMPLEIGKRNSGIFDKIRTTGSTVDLASVVCFKVY